MGRKRHTIRGLAQVSLLWAGLAGFTGLACTAGGCQEALFVDGTTRTQYERYQALRGEYRPPRQYTALGDERPALRQRLAPLDKQ